MKQLLYSKYLNHKRNAANKIEPIETFLKVKRNADILESNWFLSIFMHYQLFIIMLKTNFRNKFQLNHLALKKIIQLPESFFFTFFERSTMLGFLLLTDLYLVGYEIGSLS